MEVAKLQDMELMNTLKSSPDIGLEYLMEQYAGIVFSIIKGKLFTVGTEEDIKEDVSDVFMMFYQQLDQIDLAKGSIKTYLAVMAKHKGIDLYRKLGKSVELNTSMELVKEQFDEQFEDKRVNLENKVIDKEQKKVLLEAIDKLGEPDKEIFIRKYYMDQKSKEIAETMNLKVNTDDKKYPED